MSTSPRPTAHAFKAPPRALAKPAPAVPTPSVSPFRAAMAAASTTPVRVVKLPPSAWANTWADRKGEPVDVGLRLYAEADAVQARASAAQIAWRKHPQGADEDLRLDAFNGAVMAHVVARGTCDPQDATLPFFGSHEGAVVDIVPEALTPKGIAYLFDEIEAAMVAEGATSPEAEDADLTWLADALRSPETWNRLPLQAHRRVRRMLARVIADLRDPT